MNNQQKTFIYFCRSAGLAAAMVMLSATGCARSEHSVTAAVDSAFISSVTSAQTFEQLVVNAEKPVLVDFWAPWCGPCRAMEPDIAHIAERNQSWLNVVKINVDNNKQLAEEFQIRAIPTLMIFRQGKVISMYEGAMRRAALDHWIREQLKKDGVSVPDPVS